MSWQMQEAKTLKQINVLIKDIKNHFVYKGTIRIAQCRTLYTLYK